MAGTTKHSALIRDLPVDDGAVRMDALADALADAVSAEVVAVDPDAASPGGFARFERAGARFQTWPAGTAPGEGLWDRLTGAPGGSPDPAAATPGPAGGDVAVQAVASDHVPEDERFVPVEVPVRPAGGDDAWPGAVPA